MQEVKKMQKIDAKYLMWKMVIYLLLMVMVLAPVLPTALILRAAVKPMLLSKILSVAAFILFLFFQRWLLGRSDLSHISKARYIAGESLVYASLTLIGCILLFALSRGAKPPKNFSWPSAFFLPVLSLSYLSENIFLGFFLQCVLYPPLIALFYTLKKKKDPSLRGAHKSAIQISRRQLAESDYATVGTENGEAEENGETLENRTNGIQSGDAEVHESQEHGEAIDSAKGPETQAQDAKSGGEKEADNV